MERQSKVLIVDDDQFTLRSMVEVLEGESYQVVTAASGAEALDLLKQDSFDLVLTDLKMPEVDGLEVLRQAGEIAPQAVVLILTGYASLESAVEALREGAYDYLLKPCSDDELKLKIERGLERGRLAEERQRAEEALRGSEARYRTLIEKNADGIVIVDRDGMVRLVNPAAEALFGREAEELLGALFGFPVVAGEATELAIIRKGGNTATAEMRVVETMWEGERAYLASLRDITELVRLREALRAMAMVDELTDLYNRRGFLALAQQQLKLARRTKRGALLLYTDFDHLKWINDTFGHPEGDRALIEVADVFRETFRESDISARFGGDEFVVLAIETDSVSLEILVTRLQENLEARNTRGGRRYKLSLSMGIARYDPEHPCSIDDLLARADRLMYEQKRVNQKV